MAFIEIKMNNERQGKGVVKLNNYLRFNKAERMEALGYAGSEITRKTVRNLSGLSHSKHPGNSNPYPGAVTGTLKRSAHWKLLSSTAVLIGVGGFAKSYARLQHDGGTIKQKITNKQRWFLGLKKNIWLKPGTELEIKIPGRPYLTDAYNAQYAKVVRRLKDTVRRSM